MYVILTILPAVCTHSVVRLELKVENFLPEKIRFRCRHGYYVSGVLAQIYCHCMGM